MPTFNGHGENPTENDIGGACWSEIASLVLSNIEADSLSGAYPATCPDDPHQICGTNTDTLYLEFSAHALPSPFGSATVPAARDILHLVRFVHRRLGKAKPTEFHEARSHHHLNVDEYLGKLEFRQQINGIFARYGTSYQMDETGHMTRLEPKGPGQEEARRQRQGASSSESDPMSVNVNRMSPRAFISHSSQDHEFVVKFATDLRTNGVDAWFSKWEIKPGDSIPAKIDEGLEDCEFFIIVLSKSSIDRPWVQTELAAATVRKQSGKVRKIIPVKIQDCGDLPSTLASLLWEDFSNQPYDLAFGRVHDSIFGVDVRPPLGKPRTPRGEERFIATPPITGPNQQQVLGFITLQNGRKEPFVRISGIAGWPDQLHYFRSLTEMKETLPHEIEAPKVSFKGIAWIDFLEETPAEKEAFGGYFIRKGRIELKGGKSLGEVYIGANVDITGDAGQTWKLYSSKPRALEFK
jgi:hypothetical protein